MNIEENAQTSSKEDLKSELAYWLALYHMPKVGLKTIQKLRKSFPSWGELFNIKQTNFNKLNFSDNLRSSLANPPWDKVEQSLNWLEENPDHYILTIEDLSYPPLLREIATPPVILFVRGNVEALATPQLAMVGSRNPSPSGIETAHAFAHDLAKLGFTITSGLAIGIDGACHRGALSAQGKTLAVIGTGIDQIYPVRHQTLAQEILARSGALISEFPLKTAANAKNFPQRNRIISGLSIGTLVLEATTHSGSLITARFAAEAGREVFAIPGSIHNPLARGCHAILRQGAKLVETAADIIEELGPLLGTFKFSKVAPQPSKNSAKEKIKLDLNYRKLLECVDYETTAIDVLVMRSGFSADVIATMLTGLELKNLVQKVTGGYIKRKLV